MAHSRHYLERCQKLKEIGIDLPILQGSIVSRGFADLGYEEFAVLSSTKLVSLYTGNISSYSQQDLMHLFVVPSVDMMCEILLKDGYEIASLTYVDQRTWKVELLNSETGQYATFESISLEELWLEALISKK